MGVGWRVTVSIRLHKSKLCSDFPVEPFKLEWFSQSQIWFVDN